jgi:hypothetical protein
MLLQLLPRSGGLGERLGVLLAPFNLCSVALAYIAATVVDATGNYRLIWLFPAATGVAHATVNCWLKIPPPKASSPDMVKRVWEWAIVQAESMAETGIVTGLLAAPLLGVVTKEDADSAVIVDMARKILGNPYEDEDEDEGGRATPESSSEPDPPEPSDRGVTGVIQVGGGPVGTDLWIDQKSGPRTGSETDSSSSAGSSDAAGSVSPSAAEGPDGHAGTPAGGVIPSGSEGTPTGPDISHASGVRSSVQPAKDSSDGPATVEPATAPSVEPDPVPDS